MFDSIRSFTSTLRTLDPSEFAVADVEAHLDAVKDLRSCLTAINARLLSRSKDLAAEGQGAGPIETLTRKGDTSSKSASKAAEQSETLDDAPDIADALVGGDVTEDHVDALTAATRDLAEPVRSRLRDDPDVTDAAKRLGPDEFGRYLRRRAQMLLDADAADRLARLYEAMGIRIWVRGDGTHVINGQLDPEHGASLLRAVDAEMATLAQLEGRPFNDHTRALALAALVRRGLSAGPNAIPADVTIIDAITLADGPHDDSVCETGSGIALSPETVRRLLCHARVTAIVVGDDGVVLDAGTELRVANREQRRALRVMYRSCVFGDCHIPFDHCQVHHITPWEDGGATDLANLVPVCHRHHHLLHEGRWNLRIGPGRTLTITRPDTTVHSTHPLPSIPLATHLRRSGAHPPDPSPPTLTAGCSGDPDSSPAPADSRTSHPSRVPGPGAVGPHGSRRPGAADPPDVRDAAATDPPDVRREGTNSRSGPPRDRMGDPRDGRRSRAADPPERVARTGPAAAGAIGDAAWGAGSDDPPQQSSSRRRTTRRRGRGPGSIGVSADRLDGSDPSQAELFSADPR
jgi:hypothetical protein